MIRTPLCDVLGIDVPILCAPFGPWDEVDLAAAVCDAGGLGSLGTTLRSVPELRDQWARLRDRTERPFAVNHTMRPFDEDAFAATLEAHPAAISCHIGGRAELVRRAHDAGILWIQQVFDLDQARRAVEHGADVVIAQGGEAGGNGGSIGAMVMVPAVVDIVGDIPVVASGGIADGRGLAAALALGAQGVNLGTRFLATTEMRITEQWKEAIVAADALDAVKVDFAPFVLPPLSPGGVPAVPRVLRTSFVDRWNADVEGAEAAAGELRDQIRAAVGADRLEDLLPFAGQSAALIHDVAPAATVITRIMTEAEESLRRAAAFL
jgi:nitronate monooxygenase/enoyl-[acyl-carrier protein] reductase II